MATLIPPPPSPPPATDEPKTKEDEKVNYLDLPCPIPYEEIHREALSQSLSLAFSIFFLLLMQFADTRIAVTVLSFPYSFPNSKVTP